MLLLKIINIFYLLFNANILKIAILKINYYRKYFIINLEYIFTFI